MNKFSKLKLYFIRLTNIVSFDMSANTLLKYNDKTIQGKLHMKWYDVSKVDGGKSSIAIIHDDKHVSFTYGKSVEFILKFNKFEVRCFPTCRWIYYVSQHHLCLRELLFAEELKITINDSSMNCARIA